MNIILMNVQSTKLLHNIWKREKCAKIGPKIYMMIKKDTETVSADTLERLEITRFP
jgi:hypothetical protein